jgi:hypothetical protein
MAGMQFEVFIKESFEKIMQKNKVLENIYFIYKTARTKCRKWVTGWCICHKIFPSLVIRNNHPQYIITLTSYRDRVEKTAPYAIYTLFKQNILPDRIILYVAEGTAIPPMLQILQKKGLEIRFCKDMGPHTKLVPALMDFPEDVLITADDDIYYPKNWFKRLKGAYLNDPSKIHCHRTREISFDSNHNLKPYKEWPITDTIKNGDFVFPNGVGGIIYPPHSLDPLCIDVRLFQALTPKADDIWFWAMANLRGTKFSIIKKGYSRYLKCVDWEDNAIGLNLYNVENDGNMPQLNAVINQFPILKDIIYGAK